MLAARELPIPSYSGFESTINGESDSLASAENMVAAREFSIPSYSESESEFDFPLHSESESEFDFPLHSNSESESTINGESESLAAAENMVAAREFSIPSYSESESDSPLHSGSESDFDFLLHSGSESTINGESESESTINGESEALAATGDSQPSDDFDNSAPIPDRLSPNSDPQQMPLVTLNLATAKNNFYKSASRIDPQNLPPDFAVDAHEDTLKEGNSLCISSSYGNIFLVNELHMKIFFPSVDSK
jgi:hypothetical protein